MVDKYAVFIQLIVFFCLPLPVWHLLLHTISQFELSHYDHKFYM